MNLSSSEKPLKIGMIARWQPVHLGHEVVLRGLCEVGEHALIGIGSINKHNWRNPFSQDEVSEMIKMVLADYDNYTLLPIDDLDDGPRWRLMILELFGELDVFFTANPYVRDLLKEDYLVEHPIRLVPKEEEVAVDGRMVRLRMARGEDWQQLVPSAVAAYIVSNRLDERFRREFGLQTLAQDAII